MIYASYVIDSQLPYRGLETKYQQEEFERKTRHGGLKDSGEYFHTSSAESFGWAGLWLLELAE